MGHVKERTTEQTVLTPTEMAKTSGGVGLGDGNEEFCIGQAKCEISSSYGSRDSRR
jgi:hypothetical protein